MKKKRVVLVLMISIIIGLLLPSIAQVEARPIRDWHYVYTTETHERHDYVMWNWGETYGGIEYYENYDFYIKSTIQHKWKEYETGQRIHISAKWLRVEHWMKYRWYDENGNHGSWLPSVHSFKAFLFVASNDVWSFSGDGEWTHEFDESPTDELSGLPIIADYLLVEVEQSLWHTSSYWPDYPDQLWWSVWMSGTGAASQSPYIQYHDENVNKWYP